MDVSGEMDQLSVDLSSLVLIDADTKIQLNDMAAALTSINYAGLKTSLGATTATADFTSLVDALNTAANSGVDAASKVNPNCRLC